MGTWRRAASRVLGSPRLILKAGRKEGHRAGSPCGGAARNRVLIPDPAGRQCPELEVDRKTYAPKRTSYLAEHLTSRYSWWREERPGQTFLARIEKLVY